MLLKFIIGNNHIWEYSKFYLFSNTSQEHLRITDGDLSAYPGKLSNELRILDKMLRQILIFPKLLRNKLLYF